MPTVLETITARLDEARAKRDTLVEQRGALLDQVALRDGKFTPDEQSRNDALTADIDGGKGHISMLEARVAELRETEQRNAVAGEARREVETSSTTTKVPEVYARGNHQVSFFRDLYRAQLNNDTVSFDRLRRHSAFQTQESRALGNTNTTGGSGGEFAPPAWWVDEYIKALRPARPVADLLHHADIPPEVSSINIPKILTGTTTAVQTTQNTALSQTDPTTGSVGTGFTTVGGKVVVSQQMLDQSATAFDQVIQSDLAADYVRAVDFNVLNGTGTGANNNSVVNGLLNTTQSGTNAITWTQASPTAQQLYAQGAKALAAFATNRLDVPTHWIMHPRRWYSLLGQSDTQGRPLVTPDTMLGGNKMAFNPAAANTGVPVAVSGMVGYWLGLPVIVDPLMPTTLGAGTEDRIYLGQGRRPVAVRVRAAGRGLPCHLRRLPRRAVPDLRLRRHHPQPAAVLHRRDLRHRPHRSDLRHQRPVVLNTLKENSMAEHETSLEAEGTFVDASGDFDAAVAKARALHHLASADPEPERDGLMTGPAHERKYGLEREKASADHWRERGLDPYANGHLHNADAAKPGKNADAPTSAPPASKE
jgi:HK97 family phage major capsid protein